MPKVNATKRGIEITGDCSLGEALKLAAASIEKKCDVQLKLAKIGRDERKAHLQAESEVRAEELIGRMRAYADALENLPPEKKTRIEKMAVKAPVKLENHNG